MKKSLIALAVLAASGASMAQSSVTLYGIADIWFGSAKSTQTVGGVSTSTRDTVLESGGISGSRWGIKGSEDLGGGLKANFNLEQGFALDTGAAAGVQFNRQAWVGVSGGFGDVKLGRTGTAYDDILGTNNNTFDSALTARPWVGYVGVASNQVYYATPSFGGFSGAASYALGEDKGATTSAGKIFALHAKYENGPLMVGFAHQAETSGATTLGIATGGDSTVLGTAGDKVKYNLLTGAYNLGVVKLLGSVNNVKATETASPDTFKANEYQIGVDIPVSSSMTFALGYGQSKEKFNGVNTGKGKAFSAAVSYSLSKRTSVYAGLLNNKFTEAVSNDSEKEQIYAAGVKHTF